MSATGVIVEAALPQPLAADLAARAQAGGRSVQVEIRLAVAHWVAHEHHQGEMLHPGDVATGFEQRVGYVL